MFLGKMCCTSCCPLVLVLYLIVSCMSVSEGLDARDVKIKVPQAVVRGKNAELLCSFDLEGEKIYSVKWYRGQFEFFHYTPKEKDPVKVFPVNGIKVKLSDSTATRIILEDVPREVSGPFSCEVTAEMPSFFTAMQTAEMKVVDIPKTDPYITGLKNKYSLEDDVFRANCTSEFSYPAVNITWYINGLQIRPPHVSKRTLNYDKYITVTSSIQHRLTKKLFPDGRMEVRCAASLYDVYHKSTTVSVKLVNKKHRNRHPDWPPTTKAPPPDLELDYDNLDEDYESSIESPPDTTLRFWSTSAATIHRKGSAAIIALIVMLTRSNIFLR